ncbi:restriction endonuclease [Geomonas edaphica]|uniref:restriction endonuclease n=1 Tax=Geomonas edaphica TaxID=2570226 RepID=UPI0010A77E20|nr:restriction endonuclease [Geomonas edaphica]
MKSYPPSHVDPRAAASDDLLSDAPAGYAPPSNETLVLYVERYWQFYRESVEQYFGDVANALSLYASYPYESTVVRLGENGVIVGHRPASHPSVKVLSIDDFDPPLDEINIFDIQKRLHTPLMSFNFRYLAYDEEEARAAGARAAFEQALAVFWQILSGNEFEALCRELAVAEGINVGGTEGDGQEYDFFGKVYLDEPGRFVREESWGFQLKHYKIDRASAAVVRESEQALEQLHSPFDIVCLVTSGDLTSIGKHVVVKSPRIRVWDRAVLNLLLHTHPEIMQKYFNPYAKAVEQIQAEWANRDSERVRYEARLKACSSGQMHFRSYEDLGVEILQFLFPTDLGEPRVQARTEDGVERRDVLFRNNRLTRFFKRIGDRFDADFIIVDFKNYADPIGGEVVNDVATYANKALGRFLIIVSRKGGNEGASAAQLRRFRNDQRLILIVSDAQLMEMIERKESGESPDDILEDLLDELLIAY